MEFWKKLKYWQKGGIIGAILYSVSFQIIWMFLDYMPKQGVYQITIPFVPLLIGILILCGESHFSGILPSFLCDSKIAEAGVMIFVSLIMGFLFGTVIGLTIGKFKNQKKL